MIFSKGKLGMPSSAFLSACEEDERPASAPGGAPPPPETHGVLPQGTDHAADDTSEGAGGCLGRGGESPPTSSLSSSEMCWATPAADGVPGTSEAMPLGPRPCRDVGVSAMRGPKPRVGPEEAEGVSA